MSYVIFGTGRSAEPWQASFLTLGSVKSVSGSALTPTRMAANSSPSKNVLMMKLWIVLCFFTQYQPKRIQIVGMKTRL